MKILCIDGGGIRGVFAIAILQALEKEYEIPVNEHFDVVAGSSTGAIIAASIVLEKQMNDVMTYYKKYGKKIFKRQAKVGIFKSVYSDRYLRHFFQKAFGECTLSDIKKPLLIPAVDVTHGKPYIYRSNYGNSGESDLSIKLWDAVLSSCSAPIYFPPNNINNKYLSIDGGLWANNPSLVGVTEAIHHFKTEMNNIKILSLGTGIQAIDFSMDKDKYWGVKQWLPFRFPSMKVTPKLLDLALHLSSESTSYHCNLLLGDNYLRINKDLGEEVPFDELKFINKLSNLGKQAFNEHEQVIKKFLNDNR
ncbi:CBASS cGAMP-activated phospholipase [Aquibacillus albus]|uniref:Patatin-like phospholipase/acyl hydrolase n=1 Tax=Aquibacillus albus TaxID=1168171 RepID=A0ABS2N5A8_9BACI|nr:CBASS cGAMP-activated phospholipase [Aquibacillus albus]MBM7573337.1 patatin-like phospholipase/acyl hydrolase [Aquibacillus albus]